LSLLAAILAGVSCAHQPFARMALGLSLAEADDVVAYILSLK
jgi:hypothetical protein